MDALVLSGANAVLSTIFFTNAHQPYCSPGFSALYTPVASAELNISSVKNIWNMNLPSIYLYTAPVGHFLKEIAVTHVLACADDVGAVQLT